MIWTVPTPLARLQDHANRWGVVVEATRETKTSIIAYGQRGATDIVLKLVKHEGDEWHSGEVVEAFAGHGVARVYEHTGGALLIERLRPGHSLVDLSIGGKDAAATDIIAQVIAAMTPTEAPERCPTVAEWGKGFDRYLETNEQGIPQYLVVQARSIYADLCHSQVDPRLLHGDLQHSNVLYDRERGWVAVDPKGVIGELEYELGAMLRNPRDNPRLFTERATIERRLQQLTAALRLDRTRALGWAFAQSVLSAIWDWEDGTSAETNAPVLVLADTLRAMLPGGSIPTTA